MIIRINDHLSKNRISQVSENVFDKTDEKASDFGKLRHVFQLLLRVQGVRSRVRMYLPDTKTTIPAGLTEQPSTLTVDLFMDYVWLRSGDGGTSSKGLMKKLTSKTTFLYKKLFPILWFGFLAIVLCVGLFANIAGNGADVMFVVIPGGMIVFGYFLMKKLVWDLIDEVYDGGTFLLFRNNGKEIRVSLKDIKNVSYTTMTSPPRVTLSIRYPTDLGDELSFSPPASWIPFKKNKDIEVLIDRIDKARG
jgi:hypothetical protein